MMNNYLKLVSFDTILRKDFLEVQKLEITPQMGEKASNQGFHFICHKYDMDKKTQWKMYGISIDFDLCRSLDEPIRVVLAGNFLKSSFISYFQQIDNYLLSGRK